MEVFFSLQDFIREVDPDIVIGYNICKFDLPYLIEVLTGLLNFRVDNQKILFKTNLVCMLWLLF